MALKTSLVKTRRHSVKNTCVNSLVLVCKLFHIYSFDCLFILNQSSVGYIRKLAQHGRFPDPGYPFPGAATRTGRRHSAPFSTAVTNICSNCFFWYKRRNHRQSTATNFIARFVAADKNEDRRAVVSIVRICDDVPPLTVGE